MFFAHRQNIYYYLLQRELKGEVFGYVSTQTPLISNLSIKENIALILEAKYRVNTLTAQDRAKDILKSLNLSQIISRRPAYCTSYEIFVAQFIRASLVEDAKMAIIIPVEFLVEQDIIKLINFLIKKLDFKREVTIFDLTIHIENYRNRGLQCHIVE